MALDQWPFLTTPLNISLPEPLLYDSYIQGNESDLDLNISKTREHHQDKTSSMVITFIYIVVCGVGLCGNALVIYVILRYAKMKTVTNIYILNLAVADVLCMMSLPFIALQLALVHWPFGEVLCRLIMTVGRCEEADELKVHPGKRIDSRFFQRGKINRFWSFSRGKLFIKMLSRTIGVLSLS